MSTLFLKPASGRKIRYPDMPDRTLPQDGAEVPATAYWRRRLADGDVVAAKPPKVKGDK